MTSDEWYEIALTKGTRGEMVLDILRDWRAEQRALKALFSRESAEYGQIVAVLSNPHKQGLPPIREET